MRHTTKLVFAGLAAALLMSFAVGTASARRIRLSEQGFLARWTALTFKAAGQEVKCPVTLEGSFHSKTLSKVCGQLVGYVSTAQVPRGLRPPCTGGLATALTETLPWHIQYRSFAGTLPTIEKIRIQLVGARFQVQPDGFPACLAGTTQSAPAAADITVGAETGGGERDTTTIEALEEFAIPLGGGFACTLGGSGRFSGTGEVFTLVTPQSRIKVRLVQ
jgi:hypothetical protein